MSKVRFHQTINGSLQASVNVHTNRGLRRATTAIIPSGAEGRATAADFHKLTQELFANIESFRNGTGERKVGV